MMEEKVKIIILNIHQGNKELLNIYLYIKKGSTVQEQIRSELYSGLFLGTRPNR